MGLEVAWQQAAGTGVCTLGTRMGVRAGWHAEADGAIEAGMTGCCEWYRAYLLTVSSFRGLVIYLSPNRRPFL